MKGLHPVTKKRIQAFCHIKRAYYSLWLLLMIYGLSLLANILANDKPLLVKSDGKWYSPVLFFVPEDTFLGNGRTTRPDYKALEKNETFAGKMIWPFLPYGPNEGLEPADIDLAPTIDVYVRSTEQVARLDLGKDGRILRARNDNWLGENFSGSVVWPVEISKAVAQRFANEVASELRVDTQLNNVDVEVQLNAFDPRKRAPRSVRMNVREKIANPINARFKLSEKRTDIPVNLSPDDEAALREGVSGRVEGKPTMINLPSGLEVTLSLEQVSFPFRPVSGHYCGLDSSGRDVLVRILYATRIALNFGFLLVLATMILGIAIGAIQGYYGGWVDLSGQRVIEIWEALPFLYIMMLLGSVLGTSFMLLLLVYASFNWIGISYYMRAEFLRLRSMPFIDAVRVMGLPTHKIIFRHILPSSLVPIITFFPFSLVGAISALTSLDYLGFGLPVPTPSWGELLAQAQEFQFAWWLVLFPGLALFILVLLGVFIGEGIREAYDPRRAMQWEG